MFINNCLLITDYNLNLPSNGFVEVTQKLRVESGSQITE